MKKNYSLISLLLVIVLLLSMSGNVAFADGVDVTNATLIVNPLVNVPESEMPAETENLPVCVVTYVDHSQGDFGSEFTSGPLGNMLGSQVELLIQPPEGYYVSNITMTNEAGMPGSKSIFSVARAHNDSTEVSVWFNDIIQPNSGLSLKSDYVAGGGTYTMDIVCDKLDVNAYSEVTVGPSEAYYDGFYGGSGTGTWSYTFPSAPSEPVSQDGFYWQFDHFELQYNYDGPVLKMSPGQSTLVYRNATLTAKWNDVTAQYATPDPQDLTIRGVSATVDATSADQYFNASDINGGYTWEGLIDGDRIEGEGIVSGGGSTSFDVIVNRDAIRIKRGDADVTDSYNIYVENGYVTVNPYVAPLQNLTVRGVSTTVDATSADQYFNASDINGGYTWEGLIDGDRIEGEGIVSGGGSTSFDVIVNRDAIRIKRGDADVTDSYNIYVENGYVTVNPYVAPVLTDLTIRGVSATVDATSEDQVFYANQIAAEGFTYGYQAVGLLPGDSIVDNGIVTSSGSTSFDVIVNTGAVQILRDGQDVTSQYNILAEDGYVTVNPYVAPLQNLTVRGVSTTVDATSADQYFNASDIDGGYTWEGLIDGDRIEGEGIVSGGGSTSFDVIVNRDAIRIKRGDADVTDSYNIYVENGYVTVNPFVHVPTIPTVTVQVEGASKNYDGTELTASPYTVVNGSLDGYQLNVEYNGIVTPGTAPAVLNYTLTDVQYGDVFDRAALDNSGNFVFDVGTLEIKDAIPTVTLTAISSEKVFDGTALTIPEGAVGYTISDGEIGSYYRLNVAYGSITDVGSTPTISDYSLSNPDGETVFDRAALDSSTNFTVNNGTLTVKEKAPDPVEPDEPVVPVAILQGVTETKKFDGQPLTKSGEEGYTLATSGLGKYHLRVEYNTITEVGSVDTLKNYELLDENNTVVFDKKALDDSPNFTVTPGKLIIEAADAPTVPAAVLIAVSESKEYDGKPLTKSGSDGYEITGTLGDYKLVVTYNTITEVGSVDTISTYELQDQSGKVVFSQAALEASPNFTFKNGKLTVTKPSPSIPKAALQGVSETKEYDGKALTKDGTSGYSVSGNLGEYQLRVSYNTITEPGSVDTLATYALYNNDGTVAFSKEELDASPNFTVKNGKLTVNKRALRLIAISGTLNTKGETITASTLSSQDGSFRNGYRAIGLLNDHQISGNFVQGSSNQSFKTTINKDAVQITAKNSSQNVTGFYEIETQDGYITIIAPTAYDLIVNPKSYTWTYDGMVHTLKEYEQSGLMNGDRITSVNFSDDSKIVDVGSQSNRITSVEVVSSTGGDVDANKYILISTPGTLTVAPRDLTVTAISGSLTTNGNEIIASSLSTPDSTFKNGYKVEGLVNGHTLTGNFVTGRGTSTFATGIDLNQLRVVDANGTDVTRNYNIRTVAGTITINAAAAQRSNLNLSITAKSATFAYDGTEHKLEEYTASGLVDGDVISKVTFKPSSVITNVGTQANEIQSVVILSSTGAAVNNSKYNINYYSGTLTVTKFPLTLTAVSDEKVYDGKALNNKNVKSSALANSSHKLSADYEVFDSNGNTIKNGPVDAGVYTKRVSNIKILSGATDVTANYDITTVDGTLKITDASGASSRATSTTAYYGNTFTIRSDAPYSEFQYLMVDGQKVAAENFTVKEGSTIITLKSSYIQNLKSGGHNYTIVSTSKQVDGSFTLTKAPKTGDKTSAILWIILLLAAALLIALGVFFLQRSGKLALAGGGRPTGKVSSGSKSVIGNRKNNKQELRYSSGKAYVKKPVSEVIPDLDFDPEPVEDDDPTSNLMKDFDLNLDDFRKKDPPAYTTPSASRPVSPVLPKEPDFGSFAKPAESASVAEELPDLEVEVFEGEVEDAPEVITAPEEAEAVPESLSEEAPAAAAEPDEPVEPSPAEVSESRRRGRHEAPDPSARSSSRPVKPAEPDDTDSVLEEVNKLLQSDPFSDSWYESLGIEKKDRPGK